MKSKESLLREMAAIKAMFRGSVTKRRQGRSGGVYYVVQCWHKGRNRCRYVAPARLRAYEKAVAGYRRFMELAEAYADAVIAETENEIGTIKVMDGRSARSRRKAGREQTKIRHGKRKTTVQN